MKKLFVLTCIIGQVFSIAQGQNISPTRALDVLFTNINWEINPTERFIQGKVDYIIKKTNYSNENIDFDLSNNLIVNSIFVNGKSVVFTHNDDKILIPNNTENSLDTIEIYYAGEPSNSGFDTFTQDYHNNEAVIWTLSEPYGAADWWPCRNNLLDKSDSIQIAITCPKKYMAIANGILSEVHENDTTKTYVWKHNHPIATYLVAFAVTNYIQLDLYYDHLENDSVLVENYIYPEDSAYAYQGIASLEPAFKLFSEKFMPYPYADEKYGHAQFSWGGGMEHQTVSFVSNFEFYLLAHELAHQWFGDYITCGSFQDIWLNEGFAVFAEGLATEELFSNEDFIEWKKYRIGRITSQAGGSVFVDDTTDIWRIFDGRLSYSKAGMVLQMLRTQIGDSAFFKGVRNYLADEKLANNFAFTSDLQKHFEATSNKNLTYYFNEWIYGEGFPIYSIKYWFEGTKANIYVQQFTSTNTVPFFKLKVPFLIEGNSQDTIIYLEQTSDIQSFIVDLDFEPTNIYFNPFYDIISQWQKKELKFTNKNYIIYPNPAKNNISLLFKDSIGEYSLKIYGENGVSYIKKDGLAENELNINISNIKSGAYIIELKLDNEIIKTKFVKN